jgi:uncharacterized membrane protein YeaQ/YmgE (transglycosylase-associated protein family)
LARLPMTSFTSTFAERLVGDVRFRAVMAGMVLGWVAWALSLVPTQPGYNTAMAVVVIGAGAASFVLQALHSRLQIARLRPAEIRAAVRLWVCLLGSAVVLSMHTLDRLLG